MFNLLKEKLKNWASKFSKSVEKDTEDSKIIENIKEKRTSKKTSKRQKPVEIQETKKAIQEEPQKSKEVEEQKET